MICKPFMVFVSIPLLAAAIAAMRPQTAALPEPEAYLGFRVGTDRKLARWDQVVEYMQMAARGSDRVRFTELGKTTMGNPYIQLTISSPQNLARLEEIRANQRKLAYPYDLDERAAEEIIRKNPGVMLITLTIHSSEIGSTQMSLELVHRLATERSPYIQNILDNVVFLLVPSQNPDGQVMVVDWYNKNVGTEFEYAPMPWLYHKYVGHDNNRDGYMLTQVETRLLAKILYTDWFPVAFLDEHQMGSSGARIFVPPFDDPVNQNQDPAVIATSSLMGMYLFNALNAAAYAGAQYGERYSWFWQGSLKNSSWWHNMVGLLTEVASAQVASPIEQQKARLYEGRRGGAEPFDQQRDPRRPLPPPVDTWVRTNYPRPWLGGTWRLRDIIDYETVITYAMLEAVAANREMLGRNFYRLNRKAIETGKRGDPFAYVVPAEQHDPVAAAKMLEILDLTGIEIYRASMGFTADDKEYSPGSYVVPMAQPFRGYAKDLLEPQRYPIKPPAPGQAPERPYDVTGWTLPYQMDVKAIEIKRPFEAKLARVSPVRMPEGKVIESRGRATIYTIPHENNNSAIAVNRLLRAGVDVYWAADSVRVGEREFPTGTVFIPAPPGKSARGEDLLAVMRKLAADAHLTITGGDAATSVGAWKLRGPRIGLYQPWTANIDEGWTRWLLEQYEFPYTTLHNADIRSGKLQDKFDAVVLASQSKTSILEGSRGEWNRPEHRGGIGEEGSRAIEEFVRAGGTLVTLDAASDFAIDQLGLPVRNVLRGVPAEKFFCPGSVLQIFVDNQHPLAYGMSARCSAYFLNSPAFELTAPFTTSIARAVARYPATNALQSGWLSGPEYLFDKVGAAEVSYGKGRVVLIGFRGQFRAQSHGAFKLLFNALHWSAAIPVKFP